MLTENLVQDVATEEYMTPKAVALVNAAKALSPRLLERARPTYEEGDCTDRTGKRDGRIGLFRALQPKRWGGYDVLCHNRKLLAGSAVCGELIPLPIYFRVSG